jgi:hypothetical protein
MKRRRNSPHTFEQNIAAEKAKLAEAAKLEPGPELNHLCRIWNIRHDDELRLICVRQRMPFSVFEIIFRPDKSE